MWVSGLSQGSAKLFITSSNLVIASNGLCCHTPPDIRVSKEKCCRMHFSSVTRMFFLWLARYTIFAVFPARRFGDVVRIALYYKSLIIALVLLRANNGRE
jgi:hypothetical protein